MEGRHTKITRQRDSTPATPLLRRQLHPHRGAPPGALNRNPRTGPAAGRQSNPLRGLAKPCCWRAAGPSRGLPARAEARPAPPPAPPGQRLKEQLACGCRSPSQRPVAVASRGLPGCPACTPAPRSFRAWVCKNTNSGTVPVLELDPRTFAARLPLISKPRRSSCSTAVRLPPPKKHSRPPTTLTGGSNGPPTLWQDAQGQIVVLVNCTWPESCRVRCRGRCASKRQFPNIFHLPKLSLVEAGCAMEPLGHLPTAGRSICSKGNGRAHPRLPHKPQVLPPLQEERGRRGAHPLCFDQPVC